MNVIIIIIIIIIIINVLSLITELFFLILPLQNIDPHRSGLKFQSAGLSVLCLMLQVQLSFVVNLMNVFLVRLPSFSLNLLFVFWWLQLLPNYRYNHTFLILHSLCLYTYTTVFSSSSSSSSSSSCDYYCSITATEGKRELDCRIHERMILKLN